VHRPTFITRIRSETARRVVEEVTAEHIFDQAGDPCTRALMAAAPSLLYPSR
jgi:ABC-type dipeptide/oligopeptide/nickel transport system ATPase component